jgi:uncharacterized protein YqgC (DUF456 family)
MYYLYASLFTLLLFGSWFLTLLGLPGNWLMVGLSTLFYFFVLQNGAPAFGTSVLITLGVLAILAEVLEFAASAMGIKKGGSKRGAIYSMIGSIIGGIVGAAFGLLIGAVLFAALGAMAGAVYGERSLGKELGQSIEIGKAAFWGRILGSLAKLMIGGIMLAVAATASFI